ncbi:hypothetical protein [Streptomyces sp. NPDC006285]|uniref:hypothetical protein n=1 Tax=Streptomyces sp. NPDC006285 TaxID=3364742 RepID=UPI0036BB0182
MTARIPCKSGCGGTRQPGRYLCLACWRALPAAARGALSRTDSRALARLRELHRQLDAGIPPAEIEVTP